MTEFVGKRFQLLVTRPRPIVWEQPCKMCVISDYDQLVLRIVSSPNNLSTMQVWSFVFVFVKGRIIILLQRLKAATESQFRV